MAVRAIDANELYRIEKLLDTDIVRQDKVALNLLEQVLYDIQHVPTLTHSFGWVRVEDRMPEPGSLIVYADVCIDEVAYGVLRVPQGKCHKVYNYWMCLSDRFNRRPPEGEEDA